jgi:hypothetical protein
MAIMKKKPKKFSRTLANITWGISIGSLVGMAIAEQLRRPPQDRTWQGSVFNIPYDFRPPTLERVRDEFWNKNTSRIFVPHAFGMGWGINFYPLIHPETRTES